MKVVCAKSGLLSGCGAMTINVKSMDINRIDEVVKLGAQESWVIDNMGNSSLYPEIGYRIQPSSSVVIPNIWLRWIIGAWPRYIRAVSNTGCNPIVTARSIAR